MAKTDPYTVLGIPHSASEAEIRAAYRQQVQRHHPDHNGGSPEAARRFEEVQDAYAVIRTLRQGRSGAAARPTAPPPPPPKSTDPGLEQRLAEIDRELKRTREAKREAARKAERIREDALRQAREAARADGGDASDEDLGYVTTDDSFAAILDDATTAWTKRFTEPKPGADNEPATDKEPVTDRLADLFDDLGSRLRGEKKPRGAD